jgi:hypothetical protein
MDQKEDNNIPQLSYMFNANPAKISADFFAETDKLIMKFIWKYKNPEQSK